VIGATRTCTSCGRTGGTGYRRHPETGATVCADRSACTARRDLQSGQTCLLCDLSGGRCELHQAAETTSAVQLALT
jgi:hypothetical protein